MTLPLPALAAPEPVRCLNPLCRRWLRDPVSIGLGYGPDCAHERGLTPPRRVRRGVQVVGSGPDLLDMINETEAPRVANYLTHPAIENLIVKYGNTLDGRKKARDDIAEAIRDEGKQLIARMLDTAGRSMKCNGYGGFVPPRHAADVDGCLNDGTGCACTCHDPVSD